jgi:pyridoxal phosphate enzyme (YggS family)
LIETVDSLKLAKKLNTAIESNGRSNLDIYIQVHTSTEETKSGITPDELPELVAAVVTSCRKLSIKGIMTIGEAGDVTCFDKLVACRNDVAGILNVDPQALVLSMGMSDDFGEAIERGSTSVRVGTSIFGERDYSKK